jgi:UDPglucose--hexose-1-phosphate uridylyltransferase
VVCFSPRHDLTLPELENLAIENVLAAWARASADLGAKDFIRYAQVFENKGALMGCSNPHPHSQIWAQSQLPNEIVKELASQAAYFAEHRRPLLADYLAEEHRRNERIVFQNAYFTALVPFWAVWPFEILLVAHSPVAYLTELSDAEVSALAEALKQVTTRYDNLFEISFPYSMGFHQAPSDGQAHPEWILHAHFYPPLLRSATVRKFMVGYEMLAMPQRDITAESAAERLQGLSGVHYKQRGTA